MGFEEALKALKKGKKITREGWNGKNQYVALANMVICEVRGEVFLDPRNSNIGSNFIMFVGTSGYQCGWLASQADMLANDWKVLED